MYDEELFEPVPNSRRGRIRCKVDGQAGDYYDDDFHNGWMEPHIRGHLPCPKCGNLLSVKRDGSARTHAKCPPRSEWINDPTHGQIDGDIQKYVAGMEPSSLGQRVAVERTLQSRRDRGIVLALDD